MLESSAIGLLVRLLISVVRIISNTTDAFLHYFPKLYEYYENSLEACCTLVPDCTRPAGDLPFAGFTLNVGRQCICEIHVDGCNLAGRVCLVAPFGEFDHLKGGHLILHELRIIVSLPSGSMIFFPSGLISHENIPISVHESRRAFTAFSPSAMFQWIDSGFKSVSDAPRKVRWEQGNNQWKLQKSRFLHYSQYISRILNKL